MRMYQGFLIPALLTAWVVNPSAGQNHKNPEIPQNPAWSYEQFTDVTGRAILDAGLEGTDGIHIAVEQHPRWGSAVYIFFLLHGAKEWKEFDCEQSCVINIRFDDGKLEPWPVLGPRMNAPSLGVSLAQVEELIAELRASRHFTIEAPVLAAGRASFDFYSEGLVWPPPLALVSIRTEGMPLAERNGLYTGGKYRWWPMPACYYMPNPPIPKGTVPADFHGTVKVEAEVTVEGTIENIKILESPNAAVNKSVIETMKTWKCKPATAPPNAESIPATVTFQIKLNQQ
jgi:TonB family protein